MLTFVPMNTKPKYGRPPKYDFAAMKKGESRKFVNALNTNVLRSALSYCSLRNLNWKFKSYQDNGTCVLIRIA